MVASLCSGWSSERTMPAMASGDRHPARSMKARARASSTSDWKVDRVDYATGRIPWDTVEAAEHHVPPRLARCLTASGSKIDDAVQFHRHIAFRNLPSISNARTLFHASPNVAIRSARSTALAPGSAKFKRSSPSAAPHNCGPWLRKWWLTSKKCSTSRAKRSPQHRISWRLALSG